VRQHENPSPPPEALLFAAGALLDFLAVVLLRSARHTPVRGMVARH
jgi:hypothetical protein